MIQDVLLLLGPWEQVKETSSFKKIEGVPYHLFQSMNTQHEDLSMFPVGFFILRRYIFSNGHVKYTLKLAIKFKYKIPLV